MVVKATGEKMNCEEGKHRLETREAYFPTLKKKGKVTWCENQGCNYRIDEVYK
jgi:hypothetical protein